MKENAKKFWYEISQKKLTVPSAAVILGVTYAVSNILGVFRERLIAAKFGATHLTDIFYASFKIPDIIFNLLVLGAVSAAFIPIFVEHLSEKKNEDANYVASNLLNFLLLLSLILGVVIYVMAWKLVPMLLPGFFSNGKNMDINTLELAVTSVRIMLLSPLFFAVSAVLGGILNSHKKFFFYALAPVIYNISIITGIVFFSGKTSSPIYGLLAGVIMGAFLHAAIQVPSAIRSGFRWKPVLNFSKYELPQIVKLTIPRVLTMGAQQVNILVDTIIASYFVGGITVLNFANNIQTVPTVIFAIAIATAVFPLLSEQRSKGENNNFKKTLSESIRKILFYMIPASIGMIALRAQIVRLIYGVGHFNWEDTFWTTKALGFFAVGLVAQGLIPILLRAFYAVKDTKKPFFIGLGTMVINIIFAVSLPFISSLELEVAGVALAFSLAGFFNAGMLYFFLGKRIGRIDFDNKIFSSTLKYILAALVMGVAVHYSLYLLDFYVNTEKVMGLLAQTAGSIALGVVIYFGLTYLFGCEEAGKKIS